MFSVLFRFRKTNHEILFEAKSVERLIKDGESKGGLVLNFPDGENRLFDESSDSDQEREIFVMNGSGKTVAKYVL